MKKFLAAIAASPMTYIIGFAVTGAASIVTGVAILAGAGWSLVMAGVLLIAAAWYLTRGMSPNG